MTKSEPNRNRQISKLKERGDEGVFNSRSKEVRGALKKRLNGGRGVGLKGPDWLHSFIFALVKDQHYGDSLLLAILPRVGTRLYGE